VNLNTADRGNTGESGAADKLRISAGKVVAVSISAEKGVSKTNVKEARLVPAWGLEGDAHGGDWHRQVSLLAVESIEQMRRSKSLDVKPGDFAENITSIGLELHRLPVGTVLGIGEEVLLEITQIGKQCHTGCAIFKQVGYCVMPHEGVFARVVRGGVVRVKDEIYLLERNAG
jgi:molybdopterin adenylyltransferase